MDAQRECPFGGRAASLCAQSTFGKLIFGARRDDPRWSGGSLRNHLEAANIPLTCHRRNPPAAAANLVLFRPDAGVAGPIRPTTTDNFVGIEVYRSGVEGESQPVSGAYRGDGSDHCGWTEVITAHGIFCLYFKIAVRPYRRIIGTMT
jgi:hypothetical protein